MHTVINELFNYDFISKYEDISLKTDYSNFTCIDGEEGDFGEILYYMDGELFCKRTVQRP